MYYMDVTEVYGRGFYASREIEKNEVITVCELLVLSPEDTVKVNDTDLKYYTFVYNDKQDCLVLGDGEIFNHDDNPNVGYKLDYDDGRLKMYFYALKNIDPGEQLFIDYSADTKVNTE